MRGADPIPALKQQLGDELVKVIQGWRSGDIAYLMKVDRARVSDLRRGNLSRFSLEMLVRLLARRGFCIELSLVRPGVRRPTCRPSD